MHKEVIREKVLPELGEVEKIEKELEGLLVPPPPPDPKDPHTVPTHGDIEITKNEWGIVKSIPTPAPTRKLPRLTLPPAPTYAMPQVLPGGTNPGARRLQGLSLERWMFPKAKTSLSENIPEPEPTPEPAPEPAPEPEGGGSLQSFLDANSPTTAAAEEKNAISEALSQSSNPAPTPRGSLQSFLAVHNPVPDPPPVTTAPPAKSFVYSS
eukprot:5232638-Pyramimonas_sp.AAC.1